MPKRAKSQQNEKKIESNVKKKFVFKCFECLYQYFSVIVIVLSFLYFLFAPQTSMQSYQLSN